MGQEVVGVMEFFCRQVRQPDEDVLGMLAATGGQVGQFIGRVTVQEALHEREEQLRQAQKMEAVGRLAGGIAHDFNNLLTAIMGYSQLLLRKLSEDHPLRRYAVEIHQGGERASRLTGQLLAFSRKQVLQPKVLDLNAILTGLTLMLRRLLGEQIHMETRLAADLGMVKADPGQIEQVILNLVVNARDAMAHGGRMTIETANVTLDELSAAIHGEVKAGDYVLLSVTDTGCGMEPDTLQHIFEPFFTTKGRDKGTGLGLATVYGIVRQSGGGVEVMSKPGSGSTFVIYLPRAVETVPRPVVTAVTGPLAGSETVLLVEDEDAVRSLAAQVLDQHGFKVLEARNGEEALAAAERWPGKVHLLVTDVVMPGMSGPEVAERLGKRQAELRVLYISGYTDNAINDGTVLEAGTGYLQKPFSTDALLHKVRSILDATAHTTQG
jgi:signal transduction histidine kinase/CheY-like chemotaxis protein